MAALLLLSALAVADIAPPGFPTRGETSADLPPPGDPSPPLLPIAVAGGAVLLVGLLAWRRAQSASLVGSDSR